MTPFLLLVIVLIFIALLWAVNTQVGDSRLRFGFNVIVLLMILWFLAQLVGLAPSLFQPIR